MRTLLIAGASGAIGAQVLQELLASDGTDRVIAIGRRLLPLSHPRLEQLVVDFAALDAVTLPVPVDTVFSCLGTTIRQAGSQAAFRAVDQEAVLAVARLGLRAGARHFLTVSAVGASAASGNFYSRVKGEVEAALRALPYERLTLMQPSLLTGARSEFRLGERIGQVLSLPLSPLLAGPLARYRPIASAVVARAMVAAGARAEPGVRVLQWREMTALAG